MSVLIQLSAENKFQPSILVPGRASRNRLTRLTLFLLLTSAMMLIWLAWRYLTGLDRVAQWPQVVVGGLNFVTLAAALTLSFLWVLVGLRWISERRSRMVALSLENIFALSPSEFEQYVAGLFRNKGYQVRVRGRSGDKGVDLELEQPDGRRAIVQCKRYRSTVGPDIIRELYGTLIHERAAHAFLVTTADISAGAREWAVGKPITLIDGRTLGNLIAIKKESYD